MAAKTGWQRYGTKLRHCHLTYTPHHAARCKTAHGTATLPARTTVASSAQSNCVWQIKLTLQRLLSPLAWSLSAAFCRRRARVCTVVIAVRRSRSKLVSARKSSSSSRELSCQRRRCAVTSTPLARLSTRQIEASASASVPILATIRALSIAAIVCLDRSSPSVIRLPNSVSAGGYNKQKCRLAMGALKMQNLKMTDKYVVWKMQDWKLTDHFSRRIRVGKIQLI